MTPRSRLLKRVGQLAHTHGTGLDRVANRGGPIIAVVEEVLDAQTCEALIALTERFREASPTPRDVAVRRAGSQVTALRNSTGGHADLQQFFVEGPVAEDCFRVVGAILGLDRDTFPRDLRVRRYQDVDGGWHRDTGRDAVATAVLYLNTPEGGSTEYLATASKQIEARVRAVRGRMLLHTNVDDDGSILRGYTHRSAPVRGTKHAVAIPLRVLPVPNGFRESSLTPIASAGS